MQRAELVVVGAIRRLGDETHRQHRPDLTQRERARGEEEV